ncbi:MAG: zinc ribbon domain-containing protein [Lachnospiraceae bacterium]|nr:zinc ribbon domain-containing protein [Lachnospiraceae bacterium]
MDFFGKLGEAIVETGKDVSQKATDLTEITKLKMDIRSREDFVRKQFTEMGKQYYELHKEDAEPLFEEVGLITDALLKIEELRNEIAERKGKKLCPSCGAANDTDALYCNQCGAKCEAAATEEAFEAEDADLAEETEFSEVTEDVEFMAVSEDAETKEDLES